MSKRFFLVKYNRPFVQLIENRASELDMTIPVYFKYLAIKDIYDLEIMKTTNEIHNDNEYFIE